MEINSIFENNKKVVSNKFSSDTHNFENPEKGQSPDFPYIRCSYNRRGKLIDPGLKMGRYRVK